MHPRREAIAFDRIAALSLWTLCISLLGQGTRLPCVIQWPLSGACSTSSKPLPTSETLLTERPMASSGGWKKTNTSKMND